LAKAQSAPRAEVRASFIDLAAMWIRLAERARDTPD
jgi:hypothetical protein